MGKIIKNLTVAWSWDGDRYALKGFNIAITEADGLPTAETVAFANTSADATNYVFRNITLDTGKTYTSWVQSIYENDDSEWLSNTSGIVSDDGVNTLTTVSEVTNIASTKAGDAVTTANGYTNTKVSGIKIGGRNILRNTAFEGGSTTYWTDHGSPWTIDSNAGPNGEYALHMTKGDWTNNGLYQHWTFSAGEQYTVSCWVKVIQNGGTYLGVPSIANGRILPSETLNVWQFYSATFIGNGGSYPIYNISQGAEILTCNFKLEKGNKATDWTAAPEDVTKNYTDVATNKATAAVNTVQIGGRNLWISSRAIDAYESNTNVIPSTPPHQTMTTLVDVEPNQVLTWQIWNPKRTTNPHNTNRFGFLDANGTHIGSITLPNLTGEKYQTGTITAYWNAAKVRLGCILGDGYNSTRDFDIKFKVEKGNKPTDWSPAPEDVDSDIGDVNEIATAAKTAIQDMSSDDKMTAVEKGQLAKEWAAIAAERASLDGMANSFGITTPRTEMTNAYNELNNVLNASSGTTNGVINGILLNMAETTTLNGANFRTIFNAYYDKKAALQRIVSEAAKTQAISYADTQVANVQVGARNTYIYSATPVTNLGGGTLQKNHVDCPYGFYAVGDQGQTTNIRLSNVIKGYGDWTVSFDLKGSQNGSGSVYVDICDIGGAVKQTTSDNGWSRVSITANVTNYSVETYNFVDIAPSWSYIWVKNIKVEKGNKTTEWTPAPEDVAYDIEKKADSTAVAETINGVSSAASGAQAIANAKLDKSAYDNFIKEYGEYKTALAADQSAAAGNLQAAQTAVASIKKEMGDMKESWMFNNGTKIEATPNGMLISDGNPSGMNMLLSQNRLSFFDGGVEVAYIADKTMKINNGIFVKSARIGSHLISTSPVNSDITIVSFVGEG